MGDNSFFVCCSLFDGKNTKKFPEIFSPAHYPSIFSSGPRRWGREGQWECHHHNSDRGSCPRQGGTAVAVKVFTVFGPEKDSRVKRNWVGAAVDSGAGMVGREVGPGVRAGSCGEQPTRRVKAKRRGKMRFIKQNAFLYHHCSTAERRMPETKGYRGGQGQPDKTVGR